jgi:hypothetical protein
VRNERPEPVSVRVVVTGDDGTVYDEEADSIARGVARSFEVEVGSTSRHEVTVSHDDWRGQLAWDTGTCACFEGTVVVTPDSIDAAAECVEQR